MLDPLIRTSVWSLVALVTLTTLQDLSFFSLHPISMSLFLACASEASIALRRKRRTGTKKKDKDEEKKKQMSRTDQIDLHASLGFAAVIYYVKEMNKKEHATTYHGLAGYTIILAALGQALFGMFARQL
ncbi:hypothetical protein HK101_003989, partial [Irineochytrium annulatum]